MFSKKMKEAIHDYWKDDDGYWVILKEGYEAQHDGARTVNGETYTDLIREMKLIKRSD
jgi:hypothetical protein